MTDQYETIGFSKLMKSLFVLCKRIFICLASVRILNSYKQSFLFQWKHLIQ